MKQYSKLLLTTLGVFLLIISIAHAEKVVTITSYDFTANSLYDTYYYPANVTQIKLNTNASIFSFLTYYPSNSSFANASTCTEPGGYIETFDISSRYPLYGNSYYNGTPVPNWVYYKLLPHHSLWNTETSSFLWDYNPLQMITSRCDGYLSRWEFPATHNLVNFTQLTVPTINSMKLVTQENSSPVFRYLTHYGNQYLGLTVDSLYLIYANLSVVKLRNLPVTYSSAEYIESTGELVLSNSAQLYIFNNISNLDSYVSIPFSSNIIEFHSSTIGKIFVHVLNNLYVVSDNRNSSIILTDLYNFQSFSLSANNSMLVTVSNKSRLKVWNVSSFDLLYTYNMLYEDYLPSDKNVSNPWDPDYITWGIVPISQAFMDNSGLVHLIQRSLLQFNPYTRNVLQYRDGQPWTIYYSSSTLNSSTNVQILLLPIAVTFITMIHRKIRIKMSK